MSTLGIRLKRRARILAAGLTLSAATLAIVPGIAEAQNLGSAQNTNSANHTLGQVAAQNGVDSGANLNGSPNASLASPGSYQGTTNQQGARGSFGGAQQNTNDASYTVGQVAVQDGANSNLNANTSPNISALSPGSHQQSANNQNVYGGSGNYGGTQNTHSADYTVGQIAAQDGVNLNTNANISPSASVLSPGSEQETTNSQNTDASNTGGSGKENSNNEADHSIGQMVGQDVADLNTNANVSPNVSVSSPDSKQETHNRQNIGDSSSTTNGGTQNTNSAEQTIGQIIAQNGLDSNTNLNASPNVSVMSPGASQRTDSEQGIDGSGGGNGPNTNKADHTIGQIVVQDGADLNNNLNVSPNASVLSIGSYQETDNNQSISGGNGGGAGNDNSADHTIGQIVLQDGVNLNNTNLSPNASVLSPGSEQKTDNCQSIGGDDCTAATDSGGGDNPGGGNNPSGDNPGDGDSPGEGTPSDHIIPPPDNQFGGGPGGSNVVGDKPGGGGSDYPSSGDIIISGDDRPDGRSPSPWLADVPEVGAPRLIDPPIFMSTPRTLEVSLVAAKLGLTDTAAIGGSTLPSASEALADTPAMAPAVLASSESAPQADGAGISSLPETGGGEVWMAALGLLLLVGRLITIRKLRRRSPIAS